MDNPGETVALGARQIANILIVSQWSREEPTVLRGMLNLLGDGGHHVRIASQHDWRGLCEADAPQVIVLDVGLDVDVIEAVCAQIKREPGLSATPVLAAIDSPEAAGREEIWKRLRAAGADDFIGAPATTGEIGARIDLLARFSQANRELQSSRELLSRNQRLDELTQLLNRRFFFRAAHHECARARRYNHPLSCLMVDIDFLRIYQSIYGYSCGEYILKGVALIIRQWTRDSDIVARFGEEKYVILLPETQVEGALMLREKILRVVQETPWVWYDKKLPVTVSIGESQRRPGTPLEQVEENSLELGEDDLISISIREETADLLADADAALCVEKKSARVPSLDTGGAQRRVGILGVAEGGLVSSPLEHPPTGHADLSTIIGSP